MKTNLTKWATKAAGAGAVALLLATPAVAQSRGDWNRSDNQRQDTRQSRDFRNNDNRDNRDTRDHRSNERINASGRISSYTHERDGYRIRLDRDNRSYWVPESSFRDRGRGLRVGVSIGLGGVFRDGSIYVDAVNWPAGGYGYNGYNGYDGGLVRGMIERVDRRDGMLLLRDDASGRTIRAELNGDFRGLRPGEYVELSGRWIGGGIFGVDHIGYR
ncbi:MAG TPA: hypothetical protein VG323_05485, partial [Thermoanaerobaculia bacterium]|nr:hypothetical protein [Thermoanaerobaculia bacterium]